MKVRDHDDDKAREGGRAVGDGGGMDVGKVGSGRQAGSAAGVSRVTIAVIAMHGGH